MVVVGSFQVHSRFRFQTVSYSEYVIRLTFRLHNFTGRALWKVSKMENSRENSNLVQYDNENQMLILIQKLASAFFGSSASIILTALHYIFLPAILIYSFWAHALEQTWKITKHICHEIFEVMLIVPYTFELCYWSVRSFAEIIFFHNDKEEASMKVEKDVYPIIKKICHILNILPLSTRNAIAFHSFMTRIPIFGKGRLPFPNFLFEDAFTKIKYSKGNISITVPSPKDLSQPGGETPASSQASVQSSTLGGPQPVVTEPQFETVAESRESFAETYEKPILAYSSAAQGSSDSESVVKTSSSA